MATATTVLNLEEIRKKAGVSLETVAESTKISTRFLRAIESEEFEKLPGGVFNTNYIRQYATAIGFSEQELLALYASRLEAQEAAEMAPMPATRSWSLRSCVSWLFSPSTAQRA